MTVAESTRSGDPTARNSKSLLPRRRLLEELDLDGEKISAGLLLVYTSREGCEQTKQVGVHLLLSVP